MTFFQNRYRLHETGLLILRVGLGIMFTIHGYPKLMGGPATWTALGESMGTLGIHFAPTFWGLMAALAEAVGGQLLAVGLLFRGACLLLLSTMVVATLSHLTQGEGFNDYSHALESAIVFAGLLLTGPGRFSLDQALFPAPRLRY